MKDMIKINILALQMNYKRKTIKSFNNHIIKPKIILA